MNLYMIRSDSGLLPLTHLQSVQADQIFCGTEIADVRASKRARFCLLRLKKWSVFTLFCSSEAQRNVWWTQRYKLTVRLVGVPLKSLPATIPTRNNNNSTWKDPEKCTRKPELYLWFCFVYIYQYYPAAAVMLAALIQAGSWMLLAFIAKYRLLCQALD